MQNQEHFTRQEILQTSLHLFKVCLNNHLMNYFPLMDRYGINININKNKYIAFNIFSCRSLIISYKMLVATGISNEKTNVLTIYGILC